MAYPGECRDLTNSLDGDRQELFHLAHQVDEALRSADVRKLRTAHKAVDAFRQACNGPSDAWEQESGVSRVDKACP